MRDVLVELNREDILGGLSDNESEDDSEEESEEESGSEEDITEGIGKMKI
jgi:hypothetical protein